MIRALAEKVCERLARNVIHGLQQEKDAILSGDDSILTNAWEELCVQVQGQHSFHWDAYEATIEQWVIQEVASLLPHERDAIWLQTPAGEDWSVDDEESRDSNPVIDSEIIHYVITQYIYCQAADWTNQRIRRYLER